MSFNKKYWCDNYSDRQSMDGIGNAKTHARYLKTLFDLDCIEAKSIVDFGFGLGYLLKEFVSVFKPGRVVGIEPSQYAFQDFKKREQNFIANHNIELLNQSLQERFKGLGKKNETFDVGLLTSVLQYIPNNEMNDLLRKISEQVRYLYLTVPTYTELKKQRGELDFDDAYAMSRTKKYYLEALKPHFTFVSNRLVESKVFFNYRNTPFTEYLYRF